MTYYAVYLPDGTSEYKLYPEPSGGGTFDYAEIGRRGDGTPMISGEAIITWTWGNDIPTALAYADYLAIVARISVNGDIVVRTQDDTHTFGLWKGKTVRRPGHSSEGYFTFGLTITIDMAVPFVP